MSLTAGFDVVLEFSNATALKLLEVGLNVGSGPANPPFDLDLGVAHLIVTDIQIDLLENDVVRLTVAFDDSTVTAPVLVYPLDGFFTIDVHIGQDGAGRPVLNFPGVQGGDIHLNLSPASQALVQNTGFGGLFGGAAIPALQVFVSALPALELLPKEISVVSGQDGSYSTAGVQLERVEAHCIPHQDRSRQSLAFFGILLLANDGNGNATQKVDSAIAPGDDVCIAIAPGPSHTDVVCPALRDALLTGNNKDVSQLPPKCGISGALTNAKTLGATITAISEAFADGHLNLDLSGHHSPLSGVGARHDGARRQQRYHRRFRQCRSALGRRIARLVGVASGGSTWSSRPLGRGNRRCRHKECGAEHGGRARRRSQEHQGQLRASIRSGGSSHDHT